MRTKLLRTGIVVAALAAAVFLLPSADLQSQALDPAPKSDTNSLPHTLKASDATGAWAELEESDRPPAPPDAWRNKAPTSQEKATYFLPFVEAFIDRSHDYATRFPTNTHATQARIQEFKLREIVLQWGYTNQIPRLFAVCKAIASDTNVVGESHYTILLKLAEYSPPDQVRQIVQDIQKSDASDGLKEMAGDLIKKAEMMGKPIDLQFTAIDGRAVDVSKFRGKVVLVDFWATWCPPCVAEMPNVVKAYNDYHPKGFEIVGISLDTEKDKLTGFTADNKMPWPQFFDGQYWQNKYAVQFGIHRVPTMWLIDKKGALREMDAMGKLEEAVPKLLAE